MIDRRQFVSGSVAAIATLGLAACGGSSSSSSSDSSSSTATTSPDAKTITVFAAASMTESLTKAGDQFKVANPSYELSFNFDSSGTLKTQIEEGADCDVFISAGQKQMNALDAEAEKDHEEGLDFIDHSTRFNILENKVTLCVPDGNPKGIESFDSLAEHLKTGDVLLCMGNSDVPVGQYTQKILAYYELDEDALASAGCITYGSNVKEVTTQVSEAAVDCGVIYKTDAFSASLTVVDEATKEMCGQVVYPAAVCKNAPQAEGAKAFLEFLKGSEASADFEEVGFTPLASA
ncbi:molybdate ABC transporter substrate-binding protein [Paratractidigestivibacter sp.]|uniref:molybdate ABC transporter substrate-binding protein n=1 Tax=Paratractidigestivibacter sp. TaxID=2847316 RepID=UPI002ABE74F5|nr:molybdate ABC transporter substrate-binding protein [Paratractidigestivibacter sp.]